MQNKPAHSQLAERYNGSTTDAFTDNLSQDNSDTSHGGMSERHTLRPSHNQHLHTSDENNPSNPSNLSSASRRSSSRSQKKKLLFKMNIELGDGKVAVLPVREGDNHYRLANNFVVTHKLGNDQITKIWKILESTAKMNKDKELMQPVSLRQSQDLN